eukprot:EG_transcript_10580
MKLGVALAGAAALIAAPVVIVAFLRPKRGTAPLVPAPPVVGSLFDFMRSPLKFVKAAHEKYGDCFTVNICHKRLTFLIGPQAHQKFFKPNDQQLDQAKVYQFNVPVFGPGVVFDADLDRRLQQFGFIQKALKPHLMKTYVRQMVEEAEDYFSSWDQEGIIDLREKLSELVIMTASRCLMGKEVREQLFAEVARLYHDLDEGMQPISVFFPYLPIEKHRRRDIARLEMVKLFSKVLEQRRQKMASGVEMPDDFINTLMTATYEDGSKIEDEQITGLLIALLFGGQHTSAITSSWTGLLVFNEKERFVPALVEEQIAVRKEFCRDGLLDFDALNNMKLLHNCVKEALRLHPPLVLLMRHVEEPFEYKGMQIPQDHVLLVSPSVAHRMPSVYANPDVYDPDRFAEPRMEDKKNGPFAFISFGGGRHTCLGEHFGMLQVKVIVAVLLQHFDLELIEGLPEPDYAAMIVGPKPIHIKYRRVPKRF